MKLNIGDTAPDFTVENESGTLTKLADYRGKKLILFFYPRDNTPTCTKEACNFRDNWSVFEGANVAVLGVSPDDEGSHQKFIDKYVHINMKIW